MTASSQTATPQQRHWDARVYLRDECAVFLKTKETFGGLSNMAGGFSLVVNGTRMLTSEALYQACRFPHLPNLQRRIIAEASPMTAKMVGKPFRGDSRADWNMVRVKIMRWCLQVKFAQHREKFGELLLSTGDKPIVEQSRKDDFWGAKVVDNHTLMGINVLGRLLMELREQVRLGQSDLFASVAPLEIPEFLLLGQPITVVQSKSAVQKAALAPQETLLEPAVIPLLELTVDSQVGSQNAQSVSDSPAMTTRRLIEHRIPLEEISTQSAREKSIRHGHISTLHIWWARRPLAASRAAVFGSLVDDTPENYKLLDAIRPKFKDPATGLEREMTATELEVENAQRGKKEQLKPERLSLVNWDSSLDPKLLEPARRAIMESHKRRLVAAGEIAADTPLADVPRPKVLDCFAGGGAIPLEALRLGCEAYALDLNPVAHIIQLATLDYPQRFGQPNSRAVPQYIKSADSKSSGSSSTHLFDGLQAHEASYGRNPLAADVRYWGEWVLERARAELQAFYPKDADGATPVAYLWARTVKCTNPTCGASIPMMRQFWLAKKDKKKIALKPVVNAATKTIDFEIDENVKDESPETGTMNRDNAQCPVCGTVVGGKLLRAAGKAGLMGERIVAVVLSKEGETKSYRRVTADDEAIFESARVRLEELSAAHEGAFSLVPDEEILEWSGVFNAPLYGLKTWGHLFNARQALALTTFSRLAREAMLEIRALHDEAFSRAVGTYLAVLVSRLSDYDSTICTWRPQADQEKVNHTFTRQALPMAWDYAEMCPLTKGAGDWRSSISQVVRYVEHGSSSGDFPSQVARASATASPVESNSMDAVVTDPPYYDAVPYADLSDYFYVWLRRVIGDQYPQHFRTPLTPKAQEAVQNRIRHSGDDGKAKAFFEDMMAQAFQEMHRVLKPAGIATIVFAHKSTTAWETLISALIRAGFTVTASWPLRTEMATRLRAQDSAALASSIFLTCQKRSATSSVGMYRTVREEMEHSIADRLREFWDAGIRGADFFFSAIGPGLTAYSVHSEVRRIDGSAVSVGEFLDDVRSISLRFVLSQVLNTSSVGALDEASQFYLLARWGYGLELPSDEARKLAQSMGVEINHLERVFKLLKSKGEKTNLLEAKDRAGQDRLGDAPVDGQPVPLVDALHLVQTLYKDGDIGSIAAYLRQVGLESSETFWRYAQALSDVMQGEGEGRELQAILALRERIVTLTKTVGGFKRGQRHSSSDQTMLEFA